MHTSIATTAWPIDQITQFEQAVVDARAAGAAYYDSDTLLMSDAEYDQLVARIAASVRKHPDWDHQGILTDVAPGAAAEGDVQHGTPMLSLDKANDLAEVASFVGNLSGATVLVEAKLDGMAVRAVYRDGRLVLAATRGDGTTGEDITAQVLRHNGIKGLPSTLDNGSWTGELRGEVYMTADDFEKANTNRVGFGKNAFAKPRAAVAGALRNRDLAYEIPLSFAAYTIAGDDLADVDSHLERMAFAKAMGFGTTFSLTLAALPLTTRIACTTAEEVQTAISALGERREHLGFPIDGAVIKCENRQDRLKLGTGSRAPRWALAYKYPPAPVTSTLRKIEVGVGRTGRASFRATIDPVVIDGSVITFASLHNVDWITSQRLGIGSTVAVTLAGDIIPRVVAVGEQSVDVEPWTPPTTCPQCDQPWDTSSQLWRCTTPSCSLVSLLAYATSRDVWDVDGFGYRLALSLVEARAVTSIADLFDLTVEQIASVPYARLDTVEQDADRQTIGMAVANKLVAGLTAAKSQPLARHITALGIKGGGRTVGRWLAGHFRSMDALRAATVDELASIDGIGPEKAASIYQGLRDRAGVIDRLVAAGITTEVEEISTEQAAALPLAKMTVVITGAIDGMSRTEAQEAAIQLGAKVSSSVSKHTSLLVVGTGTSGRSKLESAKKLGVRCISGEEFAALHADLSR